MTEVERFISRFTSSKEIHVLHDIYCAPFCFRNGVSRCGIYCTISITWDKLKTEGEVDIFRAVRIVKSNRTQLVENIVSIIVKLLFPV